jgi:hypothetical protein
MPPEHKVVRSSRTGRAIFSNKIGAYQESGNSRASNFFFRCTLRSLWANGDSTLARLQRLNSGGATARSRDEARRTGSVEQTIREHQNVS